MRYNLEPSASPDKWVCTDTENKLVCVFENKNFNENQQFTLLEDSTATAQELAIYAREMGDWLRENHYNKIF